MRKSTQAFLISFFGYIALLVLLVVGAINGWSKSGYNDSSEEFLILFVIAFFACPIAQIALVYYYKKNNMPEYSTGISNSVKFEFVLFAFIFLYFAL